MKAKFVDHLIAILIAILVITCVFGFRMMGRSIRDLQVRVGDLEIRNENVCVTKDSNGNVRVGPCEEEEIQSNARPILSADANGGRLE